MPPGTSAEHALFRGSKANHSRQKAWNNSAHAVLHEQAMLAWCFDRNKWVVKQTVIPQVLSTSLGVSQFSKPMGFWGAHGCPLNRDRLLGPGWLVAMSSCWRSRAQYGAWQSMDTSGGSTPAARYLHAAVFEDPAPF